MKKTVRVLGILLLAMGMLAGCKQDSSIEETAGPEKVSVEITSGDKTGRGVIWERKKDDIYVVTAAHVLEEGAAPLVEFCDGRQVTPLEIRLRKEEDLAFLHLKVSKNTYSKIKQVPETSKSPDAQENVFAYEDIHGEYPHLGIVLDPWIYMEDFGQNMMYLNMIAEPGMSGSGVFDDENCLVGLLCGATEDGEAAAVPAGVILAAFISENF